MSFHRRVPFCRGRFNVSFFHAPSFFFSSFFFPFFLYLVTLIELIILVTLRVHARL